MIHVKYSLVTWTIFCEVFWFDLCVKSVKGLIYFWMAFFMCYFQDPPIVLLLVKVMDLKQNGVPFSSPAPVPKEPGTTFE